MMKCPDAGHAYSISIIQMSAPDVLAPGSRTVIFGELEGDAIWPRLRGASLFAPTLLPFELSSVARKKVRRAPADAARILETLATALEPRWGLVWCDVDAAGAVLIANATGLTTCDASYLWLAGSLGAELLTLDGRPAAAGAAMPV